MQLSESFLNLVKQQLSSFESEDLLERLVVYVAQTREGHSPSLEEVGKWPLNGNALLPVEEDPDVRTPSAERRWYPFQEGKILLGVLRAEKVRSSSEWPKSLELRLQATSATLTHCLSLELERSKLLEQMDQQRSQISLMVHQIRNPLAALRTYAQLLLRRLGPESIHHNLVQGLLTEQDQLNRYVSALDQIGQFNLPIEAPNSSPLLLPPVFSEDLNSSIRDLLTPLMDRAAATANLQNRLWITPIDWPSWTEMPSEGNGEIAEIVANLLENAFRYSPSSTSLGLKLKDGALCVWDSGNPIANDEREKIFYKGFRGKNTADISGSGIGLALGRQLAEKLGGSLSLISSPADFDKSLPAKGNAFVLTIPFKDKPKSEE